MTPVAEPTQQLILLIHAWATLMMTGLIWFVQIVHYPLMSKVGSEGFIKYEASHTRRTTTVVGPLMLIEALAAGMILTPLIVLPSAHPTSIPIIAMILLVLIWLSTACIQVPAHQVLEKGFDPAAHRKLVNTNWIRTALWSVRSVLALSMLFVTA
ncbi:MAG: hypothetical protein AB8C13_00180 [Phycisphaerales bacterium]